MRTHADDRHVVVEICDTGLGLDIFRRLIVERRGGEIVWI